MERMHRNERIAALLKFLTDSPNRLFTLSHFCAMFASARSTLSEDLELLRQVLKTYDLGVLDSIPGPGGGVRFRPVMTAEGALAFVRELCAELRAPWRLLPGGFLYTADILGDPRKVRPMAAVIAGRFYDAQPDFVLTVASSGIPVALLTAEALGIPLVTARRDPTGQPKAGFGPAVSIHYAAGLGAPFSHLPGENPLNPGGGDGTVRKREDAPGPGGTERLRRLGRAASRRWENGAGPSGLRVMSIPRRAVREGQAGLIMDDCMMTGGTVKGMRDLLAEAGASVAGAAVAIAVSRPARRPEAGVFALLRVDVDEEAGTFTVKPSKDLAGTL